MNSYIQLKIDGQDDSTYKKLRVVFGTGSYPYSTDQGRLINRTTTGRLSKQVGAVYKYWYGSFRVKMQEDVGNATMDDLYRWMTSNTPADQRLVMRPWTYMSNTYNVYLTHNGSDLIWPSVPALRIKVGQIIDSSDLAYSDEPATVTFVKTTTLATIDSDTDIVDWIDYKAALGQQALFSVTDPDTGEYDVTFVTGVDPQGQVPVMESSGGFMVVPFRMEER